MTIEHKDLQELNAQIQIKLAEGDLEAAERLSIKLIETAEGIQRPGEKFGDAANAMGSVVSRLVNSVVSKFPQTPTAAQIAQIKEAAINDEHLRLLSVFHYVYAALTALFSSFLLIYFGLGCLVLNSTRHIAASADAPSPAVAGWFMIGFALVLLTIFWVHAALNFCAARFLKARKRRLFCFTVSGLNLMHFPLGTMLGVSSFLVLSRPAVKTVFAQKSSKIFAIKGGETS